MATQTALICNYISPRGRLHLPYHHQSSEQRLEWLGMSVHNNDSSIMRNPKPVHVERSFRFLRDGGERIDETLPLRSTPADYGCVIKTCPTGVVRTCNETIREWR